MRSNLSLNKSQQSGFTLIEIVVSIVVLGIALLIITSVLAPQARNTVDPVMDVKASELAQAFLNEALAKSYDEHSDHNGSRWRCGEGLFGDTGCSAADELGPDGETRTQFNDVDDYITGGFISGDDIVNSSGSPIGDLYPNFSMRIDVVHDAAGFSGGSGTDIAKRIDVTVRTPSEQQIVFSAYRGNY